MRRAAAAIGLLLAAALAGCSSHAPTESLAPLAAASMPLAGNSTVGPLQVAAPTDLLYLTALSRLAPEAPANLTILATLAGSLPQSFSWNSTLNGTGNLTEARLVVWLDLQDSAAQPGIGGDTACTLSLTLYLTLNKTQTAQAGGCASAGVGFVPPGEHRLEVATPLTAFPKGAHIRPGDQVLVVVSFGLSLPQGVGYVLGGPDHDSHLRLRGLVEPMGNGTRGA